MTIYDREYYRKEGPSFLGSFARHGQVCKWIILINVAVFVFGVELHEAMRITPGPFRYRSTDSDACRIERRITVMCRQRNGDCQKANSREEN